jgi:hypothetical protein
MPTPEIMVDMRLEIFVIRTSTLIRHSSFVIRHSAHVSVGR